MNVSLVCIISALVLTAGGFIIGEIISVGRKKRAQAKYEDQVLRDQAVGRIVRMNSQTPVVRIHKNRYSPSPSTVDNDSDFEESVILGMVTQDPIEATLLGGDPIGAVIGSEIASDFYIVDTDQADPDPSYRDPSDTYEPSTSNDDWSSSSNDSDYGSGGSDFGSD